jgi:predicted ATPase
VPLFVEELTKAVVESGMLTDIGDRYTAAGPVPALAIPASLQASLLAWLDRLAPVSEQAQIGAALGRQFSHELIAAVAVPGSGPGMAQRQLDDALAQLVSAELIYRRGTPPDAEYTFKHALVQDAAYGTLLRSRRQQLHAGIAAAHEDRFPEIVAAQPALLAHHCEQAGLAEKAVDYWLAAGRQAWARSAAAAAPPRAGAGSRPTRQRPAPAARVRSADRSGPGTARKPELGRAGGRQAYARAQQLAAALDRPRELLFAVYGEFVSHVCRPNLGRARQLTAAIRDLGKTSRDVSTRVLGCQASAYTSIFLGEFAAARTYAEKCLALYDPAHRPLYAEVLPLDMGVLLLDHSTVPLACLGHVDQAWWRANTALAEARRLSHPFTVADALSWASVTGWCVGAGPNGLLPLADELLALSTEHGFAYYRASALVGRGWCLAALGHADDGIPLLTTGLARRKEVEFMNWGPYSLTALGAACRMAGQVSTALGHLAEAVRSAEEAENRWALAETLRLRGDVLLAMGDSVAAEASYSEALAVARRQHAKLWELRAATSLARLWGDRGKRAEARDLLAPVYAEGFGTPVLQEAKLLLDKLAGAPGLAASGGLAISGASAAGG